MRSDLSGLLEFVLVAEKRSFTAAAAELRLTAPRVSQIIRALEERVGTRLLQRTTRNVALTEAGARFLARVKPALTEVDAALGSLEEARERPAGTLRISIPRLAYLQILQPRLATFLEEYPDICLDIFIQDDAVDLVSGGFDAGIHLGETLGHDVIAVRVSEDQSIAVVGAPSYFETRSKPRHPRDLKQHECINYRASLGAPIYRWEFTEHGREIEVAVEGRLQFNDRDLILSAAISGLGLAYVSASRAREHLVQKRLARVLEEWCPPFPGLFLYYASRANLEPKLRALIEFLRVGGSKRHSGA
ncbi:LysR family transcriptional regulator [Corallococcus sp. M34]|uniref:LysR family transcriptional regulator n=1 Tax=Citreicoccus inhibens TaxID=2849499 RepID=UPI001C24F9E2|nr:LysR family transcriptional regulator [Citreicoccus inhibens]MBU8900988.1 LysR family transcriptional regulator [Citreicoccus inhibens]